MINASTQLTEHHSVDLEKACSCYLPEFLKLELKYELDHFQFFFSYLQVLLYTLSPTKSYCFHRKLEIILSTEA